MENARLADQIHEASVAVSQRRRIFEIQQQRTAQDDHRGSETRMKEIMREGQMKIEYKEQQEIIAKLRAEVQRLEQRTFSSFENVNLPMGNVDEQWSLFSLFQFITIHLFTSAFIFTSPEIVDQVPLFCLLVN